MNVQEQSLLIDTYYGICKQFYEAVRTGSKDAAMWQYAKTRSRSRLREALGKNITEQQLDEIESEAKQ